MRCARVRGGGLGHFVETANQTSVTRTRETGVCSSYRRTTAGCRRPAASLSLRLGRFRSAAPQLSSRQKAPLYYRRPSDRFKQNLRNTRACLRIYKTEKKENRTVRRTAENERVFSEEKTVFAPSRSSQRTPAFERKTKNDFRMTTRTRFERAG